jgi:hypothetical protein
VYLAVPCRRRLSTLLKANPVENDGTGTLLGSWRRSSTPRVARTINQQAEVLHVMGGENSPRRVRLSLAGAPAGQHLAGRCSSDGRVLLEV